MAKTQPNVIEAKPARERNARGHYVKAEAMTPAIVEAIDVPAKTTAKAAEALEIPAEVAMKAVEAIVEAPKTVAEAAAPVIATIKKEIEMTTTKIENQAEAMFKDAGGKAREVMERGTKSVEQMTEFHRGNVEALVASGKAAVAGAQTLTQSAVEFSKSNIEQTQAAFKKLSALKTPNEFVQAQSDFAKSQFEALVAQASRISETYLKVMGEVFEPISNRIAVAADRVSTATAR